MKDGFDGALPSGNSIMMSNLLRHAEYTMKNSYRILAEKMIGNFFDFIKRSPISFAQMSISLDFTERSVKEIAIVQPTPKTNNLFLNAFKSNFSQIE